VSVVIVGKFKGDTAKFRQALTDRADEFARWGEAGRAAGAVHHRFAVGDGYVLVVDEWQSVQHFEKFFGDPELQAFIGGIGAAPEPPEMLVGEAVSSADEF
jgi:hypothetical protein